jgi:hypothetical protein
MSSSRHLLVLFALALAACGQRPDDTLIEDFNRNRATLDELVLMFRQDPGLARVGMTYTLPEDPADVGVSFDRLREYRALCQAVKAEGCIEGYDADYELLTADEAVDFGEEKDVIWIHLDAHGPNFSGKTKGYLYSEAPPYPVVPDLDEVRTPAYGTWLRQIDGPWYVYLDYRE